ncbi:MAG: NAD(P)-binding domain-containing protein [Fimbriimonadales bacterium]|nr:NAD(P)-binding domain-containing protein [Fimbriimonadales bacterium]MDW8052277.1 NAD(P)-binding domain-containing protein [Armatimonadota bacterium]
MERYELIIVGAGPVGLAAGIEAKRAGLEFLILEAGTICQSLVEYPIGMRFYSPADELAIGGYPFPTPHDEKPTRELALNYYRKVASAECLPIRTYERVERIERVADGFLLQTIRLPHQRRGQYHAQCVLVCTGVWGTPRRLSVEGAELPHVLLRYDEPLRFWRKRVLIVGSGNSAGEAAIRLADADAYVWLAVEPPTLEQCKFRPFILREVLLRVEEGCIRPLTEARILRIQPDCVDLRCAQGVESLPVDFVLTLIGLQPDRSLLEPLGVPFDEDGKPLHDPETYETPVTGLFVAGALSRDSFIYIARERVRNAIAAIAHRVRAC